MGLWIAGVGILGMGLLVGVRAYLQRVFGAQMVICVIRPEQLGDVVSALKREKLNTGMTVMNVRGFGRQSGETIRFLPKLKLEILVGHRDVQRTMDTIGDAVRTGEIGDGKIVAFKALNAMRIRTGERGISAL